MKPLDQKIFDPNWSGFGSLSRFNDAFRQAAAARRVSIAKAIEALDTFIRRGCQRAAFLANSLKKEKLLCIARMFERATDWHTRRPKLEM